MFRMNGFRLKKQKKLIGTSAAGQRVVVALEIGRLVRSQIVEQGRAVRNIRWDRIRSKSVDRIVEMVSIGLRQGVGGVLDVGDLGFKIVHATTEVHRHRDYNANEHQRNHDSPRGASTTTCNRGMRKLLSVPPKSALTSV